MSHGDIKRFRAVARALTCPAMRGRLLKRQGVDERKLVLKD